MSNYGVNMGKGNNYGGNTTVHSKITIKKGHIIIAITIVLVLALIIILSNRTRKVNLVGQWITEDGDYLEFLSDGTIHRNGDDGLYPDTFEIMEEGYLKIGEYDAAWIAYEYSYWNIELKGSNLTLTLRDNPDKVINLEKSK